MTRIKTEQCLSASTAFIGGSSVCCLEVQPQRQLDLPVGADADLVGHGRGQDSEIASRGGRRERDAGLQSAAPGPVGIPAARRRLPGIGEVRVVEDVVELGAELHVLPFREAELLAQREIELLQAGAVRLLRAELPKVPAAGMEKAAGLSQFSPFFR